MRNEFNLNAGPETYGTIIVAEPLYSATGAEVKSLTDWDRKLILLSSSVPPEGREVLWRREARGIMEVEGVDAEGPKLDRSHEPYYDQLVSQQFKSRGGRSVLMSLTSQTGFAPPKPIPSPQTRLDRDARIRARFGWLSDEQFDDAREQWTQLQLSPLRDHFHIVLEKAYGGPRARLVTHKEAIKLIAQRTKEYLGRRNVSFEFNEHGWPAVCHVTIHRAVGNHVAEFEGIAYWEDCFGDDSAYWPKHIAQRPHHSLLACAEINGLRAAFVDEIGDTLIEEEALASNRPSMEAA